MIFQANERLDLISLSIVIQRTLTAVAGIVVLTQGGGVVAASLVFSIGAVCGLVVSELSVRRLVPSRPRPRPQPRAWPRLLKTAFPIGVAFLLYILLLRLDVTLLSFIAGEAEVGLYAAAYRLVESTQFVAWAMSAAMMPWLSRTATGGLVRGYELGLKAMNAVLLPISLVFVLFAEGIVDLLYGDGVRARRAAAAAAGADERAVRDAVVRLDDADRARLAGHVREARRRRRRAQPRRQPDRDPGVRRRRRGRRLARLRAAAGRVEPAAGGPEAWAACASGARSQGRWWPSGGDDALARSRSRRRSCRPPRWRCSSTAVVLLAVERLLFDDDLDVFLGLLPRRLQRLVSVQIPKRSARGLSTSSNGTRARSPYTTG